MRRREFATGHRFGQLTIVREAPQRGRKRRWICLCDCGRTADVVQDNLLSGNTTSCGCHRARKSAERNWIHGAWQTPEYDAWINIKARCHNPGDTAYRYYGALGVIMCDEWRHSFPTFLEAVGHRPSPAYSIDRINPFGNYEPGNVRWATRVQQAQNTRRKRAKELGLI